MARYKISLKRDKPLTYEMSNPPHQICHRKAWNSWNSSKWIFSAKLSCMHPWRHPFSLINAVIHLLALMQGHKQRESQTIIEDLFIRKFMSGTFHGLLCSEVIIKRQFNVLRIASIMHRGISPRKMYFLIGYSEELLSNWMQCPTTLEIQTIADKKEVIHKYI